MYSLRGYDTFSDEDYDTGGAYVTYEEAKAAAHTALFKNELTQPSVYSGGQGPDGIQDRVYVVHPDGRMERVYP